MASKLLYESANLRLSTEEDNAYLLADWHGDLTDAVVVANANAVHKAIRSSGCSRLLNSNRRAWGLWTTAGRWAGEQALPQLYALGCRQIAWVLSADTYSLLSAEVSLEHAAQTPLEVRLFDSESEARAWLLDE